MPDEPIQPGETVWYTLNMGTRWECRGPVQVHSVSVNRGTARLSDNVASRMLMKYLHRTEAAAVQAAHELTKLRRTP